MCKNFFYKSFDFNAHTGVLTLVYGTDKIFSLTEQITFAGAPFCLTENQQRVLEHIFFLTHIALGISYYKGFIPENLVIQSGELSEEQAHFFDRFYLYGLGEFAVKNNLDLTDKIHFPFTQKKVKPDIFSLKERALVPLGGGKDSCVSVELLKQLKVDFATIAMGDPLPILNCAKKTGKPHITMTRQLDSSFLTLCQEKKVLNGHVPITGMLAFCLWAQAVLSDYAYVVLSCERSADEGNCQTSSFTANHQYSKSSAFENDFYQLTQEITPQFKYFSLLRPLSETHIARLFSQKCASYFDVFTSCNKAFFLDKSKRQSWCASCDKCRFVFLILALFIPKEKLISIMGKNLLADESQYQGYEELLGLSGHKPFECVGTIQECRYAWGQLQKNPCWQNDLL